MNLLYRITQCLWIGLDWLFPPYCAGCNREGFRWCQSCQQHVKPVPEPTCSSCGRPVSQPGLCPACNDSRQPYDAMRSWAIFEGPIRLAIHSLKYKRNLALGDVMARNLVTHVRNLGWKVDMVAPVPLGSQRLKERGYNQAGLLARPVAVLQDWRYAPRAVLRVRETRTQVGLTERERQENISGAFNANPSIVHGKDILLIDDVTTTGATLSACSEALKEAGANHVYALTLARALPHHGLEIV